jgi:serine/threonine protein kinase
MTNNYWTDLSGRLYNSLEDFPEGTFGFVYKVKNKLNGKIYIGKKVLYFNKKKKLTKKELAEIITPGRRPATKVVQQESDWINYWGSSKELITDFKNQNGKNFKRHLLKTCLTKKELTYWEISYQLKEDVLLVDSYNDNILGKFYRKDLVY